jgi:DNA-binding MarR family transcriptional regulator
MNERHSPTPLLAAGAPHSVAGGTPRDETAARVLRQFRQVFNCVKTHLQQMERQTGVGGAQVWALSVIREQPGIGVNDVARALDIRQPTASNLVKSLLGQGCIELRKEGADRRAVQLYLTPAGRRVLRLTPGPFSGVLTGALSRLPRTTLNRLDADLQAVIDSLGADAASEQDPRRPLGEP